VASLRPAMLLPYPPTMALTRRAPLRSVLRLPFSRRNRRRSVIETLHSRIAAASREEALYVDRLVPDTLDGRFASLALHAVLVLRRLRDLPPPADEVAQELVDCLFRILDANLRELGVGDTVIPKRMKKLAAAFHGLVHRYDRLIAAGARAELAAALAVTLDVPAQPAGRLADYLLAGEKRMGKCGLDELLSRGPCFAQLEAVAGGKE
jgi:cytochrome b pre-mRNA-processing protein 3